MEAFNINNREWVHVGENSKAKDIISGDLCPHLKMRIIELNGESTIDKHEHQFTQVLYFAFGGTGIISVDEIEYPIEEGLVVVVAPGKRHATANLGKEVLKILIYEEHSPDTAEELPFVDH